MILFSFSDRTNLARLADDTHLARLAYYIRSARRPDALDFCDSAVVLLPSSDSHTVISLARDAGRSRAMTGVNLIILIHTFGYISKHQLVDLRRCCERPRHQLENPSTLRPAHGRPVRWLWSGHTEPNFVHCESVPQEGGRATRPAL